MNLYDLTVGYFQITPSRKDPEPCYIVTSKNLTVDEVRDIAAKVAPRNSRWNPQEDIAVRMPLGESYGNDSCFLYAHLSNKREISKKELEDLIREMEKEVLCF